MTLLVGLQEGHAKTEWWGAGVERGADLHMAPQLIPLLLTVSCFSKIQIGFTFLVLAHLGSPGQRAVKWVCVYIWTASLTDLLAVFDPRVGHTMDLLSPFISVLCHSD